ncbi:MAG: hypothetical protein RL071_4813, partial [Pseudomonadota bacterium]
MSGAPTPPVTPPAAAGGGSRASVPGEPPSAELLREGDDRGAAGGWSLGPFRCLRRIGRGAMGEVWRAAHQLTGGEVAIKLLKPESGADPWSTEAFAAEVRAAASLSHPGVVQIIDHGAVTAADEGCPLPVGTPWLAMELVLGRPLGRFIGALSWAQIRDLLLQLLDALAHLHARGVLHRDIKPGNVILRAPGGGVPAPRVSTGPLDALLTDFGLAQRIGHPGPTDALVAGTPAYMAPEQLEARWRDQGPWTDLYSLGCVAWAMVTGDAPFGRDSTVEDSRRAHLSDKPPALQPLVPVPPGLEAWLRQLLHKQPERRFARAADAAWALLTLSASALRVGSPDAPRALQTLDISLWRAIGDEGEADEPTVPPRPGPPGERAAPRVVFGRRAERRRTPMPRGWRTPRPPPRSSPLRDVGLRLLGQRPRQLVGRTDAQDTLWGALSAVHADGHMRVVVLSGAEGCGRSRLGDWLVERGDEVGAVRVVRVQHAETEPALKPGPSPWGLGGMVSRALRCEGLWGAELRARLLSLFPDGHALRDDIDGLVEEMEAPPTPPELGERPASFYPRARFTRLARLLESLGDRRGTGEGDAVLTLWVDDAHQGVDALELVRFLLETQESEALPLLVLLSVRLEALVQRPRALSLLGMISDDPATVTVSVRPLGDGDHLQLCADLLPLEPELAEQLAARSGGNPMFATRILESWAAQGELVPGPQGHRLRPDARLELPADLQATWADRLERLVAGMDEREQRALELAAALGAVIDRDEWTAACALGEGEASDRLMMRLFVGRFAEWSETPRGWSFSHAMLREVLLVRAQDLGRLRDHHRAIVALLEEQARAPGGPPPGHAERVGRHLLASGAALPALGALLEGARERLRRGEPAAARRVLAMRERALAALQLPQTEEPWGLGRLLMLELDALEGDPAELPTRLDAVEQAARRHRWTRVLP